MACNLHFSNIVRSPVQENIHGIFAYLFQEKEQTQVLPLQNATFLSLVGFSQDPGVERILPHQTAPQEYRAHRRDSQTCSLTDFSQHVAASANAERFHHPTCIVPRHRDIHLPM